MKANPIFKHFQSEAEGIFTENHLQIVAPNSGYILLFDENEGHWWIDDGYGKMVKKYKSFEKAIDYLLENC